MSSLPRVLSLSLAVFTLSPLPYVVDGCFFLSLCTSVLSLCFVCLFNHMLQSVCLCICLSLSVYLSVSPLITYSVTTSLCLSRNNLLPYYFSLSLPPSLPLFLSLLVPPLFPLSLAFPSPSFSFPSFHLSLFSPSSLLPSFSPSLPPSFSPPLLSLSLLLSPLSLPFSFSLLFQVFLRSELGLRRARARRPRGVTGTLVISRMSDQST